MLGRTPRDGICGDKHPSLCGRPGVGLMALSASRVVKEEILDDNAKLPCFNGRVVSWVSPWLLCWRLLGCLCLARGRSAGAVSVVGAGAFPGGDGGCGAG